MGIFQFQQLKPLENLIKNFTDVESNLRENTTKSHFTCLNRRGRGLFRWHYRSID